MIKLALTLIVAVTLYGSFAGLADKVGTGLGDVLNVGLTQ